MKKVLLTLLIAAGFYKLNAQVIFSSSFESWTSTDPNNWVVGGTEINADSVSQITAGTMYGLSAAELRNPPATHKRLKTAQVSITNGTTYDITYWVKGGGSIRAGLYDGGAGASAYSYSSYDSVNGNTWTMYTHQITADTTSATAQFIISVRYTSIPVYIQVDSFVVSAGGGSSNTSIYNIQYSTSAPYNSPFNNQNVQTYGIVTAKHNAGYWIQNGSGAWSGLYVFDSTNAITINLGDSVVVAGSIYEYNGLTELKNITSFTKVSTGNALPPFTIVSTGQANMEDYESVLIQCQASKCTDPNAGFGQWKIYSAGDTVFVDDLMYTYNTPVLNTFYDVAGVLYYSFSEWKIEPRMASDVSVSVGLNEFSQIINVNVYPNPSNGIITLSGLNAGDKLEVYDATGKVFYSEIIISENVHSIKISNSGIYLIRVLNKNGVFERRVAIGN